MIIKIFYSFFSLLKLSFYLKNPWVLLTCFFKSSTQIKLKNGLIFQIGQPIDLITIKETVLDDEYQIAKLKQPIKYVIDVGGGLGDFSILVAKKFKNTKIISFEPNKAQYNLFLKNLKANQVTNVKVYNLAVGTKRNYFLYLAKSNIHASTVKNYRAVKKVKVKGVRLDDFISEKVDLLKIDCEGAELDVLKSISPKKIGFIHRVIIEYHNNIIQNEDKKILTILKNWRYKTQIIKNKIVPTTGLIYSI